jgi:hypothetical protein
MRRLMIVVSIAVAFAAGWTIASSRGTTAEAQAKRALKPATCKDDLAKHKRELAAVQGENAKMKVQLETIYAKERERVERMEKELGGSVGEPIRDLK